MFKLNKIYKIIIGVSITLLIIGLIYKKISQKPDNNYITAVRVATEKLQLDSIAVQVSFICKVRTFESVILASEVPGRITAIKADGSQVTKGDVILEIDASEALGKYLFAKGQYLEESAKYDNAKKLFASGHESKSNLEQQLARKQSAYGRLIEAESFLNKHTIKSPFSGKIGLHTQTVGSVINQHTKLISVTNLDCLQVEFTLSAEELRKLGGINAIEKGEMFVTFPGQLVGIPATFSAADSIDPDTGSVAIRADLHKSEDQEIMPGQIGEITINVGLKHNVITVPETALVKAHGVEYVYKVVKNMAIQTVVKSGMKSNGRIEVEGLAVNDVVIISGQYALYDGQKVVTENTSDNPKIAKSEK